MELMRVSLPMPKPGETISEALIINWIKNPGDSVAEKEGLFELETEKAVFDYESPIAGKLVEIIVPAGVKASVASPIAIFEVDDEAGSRYISMGIASALDGTSSASTADAQTSVTENQETAKEDFVFAEPDQAEEENILPSQGAASVKQVDFPASQSKQVHQVNPSDTNQSGVKKFLSPYLKKVAREKGLSASDLDSIQGSGENGRLREEDILNFKTPESKPTQNTANPTNVPDRLTAIRARIAANMEKSKREIPHAGAAVELDVSEVWDERKKLKDKLEKEHGNKLSLFNIFIYCVVQVLKRDPYLNSIYEGQGIVKTLSEVNLGLSVATDLGLMVPVVHNSQDMDFVTFWLACNELIERTRKGKLRPDDMVGGTFTVNNPGALGSDEILQVIPPNQVGILGFNRITQKPVVIGDEIKIRHIMKINLAFDHRAADGREALRFLVAVKNEIETFKLSQIL